MMNAVDWFEIPVKNMARAKQFYATVLDKALVDMNMPNMEMAVFPREQSAPNAAGALVKAESYVPSATGTTVYFSCDNLANELSRVLAAGGLVLVPKTSIGEYGFIARILDTEGNRVALHSMK